VSLDDNGNAMVFWLEESSEDGVRLLARQVTFDLAGAFPPRDDKQVRSLGYGQCAVLDRLPLAVCIC
jgi:hypothetical protein